MGRANGSSSRRLLGLFDGIANPLERLGQVERIGHRGQALDGQLPVMFGAFGQRDAVAAKFKRDQSRAGVGSVDAIKQAVLAALKS